ncbi:MAG: DNA primase [Clostridia bacterium]|nr:DNA primase [Clostridia bacterium]
MRFSDAFLDELRSRVDIESLIAGYAEVRHSGSRTPVALCPFHAEKTPSLVIYPHNCSYYCFGCGNGGDAIVFIRNIEHLDYAEAVRFLCDKTGMPFPSDPVDDEYTRLRRRCYEANRAAARFFHAALRSPAGEAARKYLEKRRLTDETVNHFGLGYAPDSWDALLKHLRGKGFSSEELVAFNLARPTRSGGTIDAFRNRLMFPIIDVRGNVVAFGGRVLDDSKPKYINTSDTVVYKKGEGIYALNFAKNNPDRKLILCEGYMDVIAMHQAGFTNAVAALGTAFTNEQITLLSRYCDELYLSFDSDEAGKRATEKALKMLSSSPMKLRILQLEGGKDPDEILKTDGAEKMNSLISTAQNDTEFALSQCRGKYDLSTDDGKLGYVNAAVEVLASLGNAVERELYIARVASETGLPTAPIAEQVRKTAGRVKRQKDRASFEQAAREAAGDDRGKIPNPERRQHLRACKAEETILASLMLNPDFYPRFAGQLDKNCFVTEMNREIYEAFETKLRQGKTPELTYFSDESNPTVSYIAFLSTLSDKIAGTPKEFEDCLAVLAEERLKNQIPAISEMSDEAFAEMIRGKKTDKKTG